MVDALSQGVTYMKNTAIPQLRGLLGLADPFPDGSPFAR
jgi:hypothetical protein